MLRSILSKYRDIPCEFINAGAYTLSALFGYVMFLLFTLIPPISRSFEFMNPLFYGIFMSIFIIMSVAAWELKRKDIYYKECVAC